MSEIVLSSTTDSEPEVRAALGLPAEATEPDQAAAATTGTTAPAEATGPDATPAPAESAPAGVDSVGTATEPAEAATTAAVKLEGEAKKKRPKSPAAEMEQLRRGIEKLQRRVSELTEKAATTDRERREIAAERDWLRDQLARHEASLRVAEAGASPPTPAGAAPSPTTPAAQPDQAVSTPPSERPREDQFPTFEAYQEALTAWLIQQQVAQRVQETVASAMEAERQRLAAQQAATERRQQFERRLEAAKAKYADFDQTVLAVASKPVTPEIRTILEQHELGPDLLYYFGQHPDVYDRLIAQPPAIQTFEIGEIAASIRQQAAAEPATTLTTPRRPAAATPARPAGVRLPAPPATVKGIGARGPINPDEMDYQTFKAWREGRTGS